MTTWEEERLSWPDTVKTAIHSGNLAIVLQCGGRGRRLRDFAPKPLISLPNNSCPLINLIEDTPPEVPIFLHGMAEEKDKYLAFLAANNNFYTLVMVVACGANASSIVSTFDSGDQGYQALDLPS